MDLFIDFTAIEQNDIGKTKNKNSKKYDIAYDNKTCLYYKSHRVKKTDPITFEELNDNNAFKFSSMWNPYTSTRTSDDPFGPLYINPINLLHHIYLSKLNGLWNESCDDENGFFEGYYGSGVGAGEDFEIIGRGIYPERYLFRLPIIDCYLKPDHSMSVITMGPRLTDREIIAIDQLIVKHWSHHKLYNKIYKKIGSLHRLKRYYDIAISTRSTKMDLNGLDFGKKEDILKRPDPDAYLNRQAVNAIRNM
jgi:hypothetical protein